MKKNPIILFILGTAILVPTSISAAIIEYSGSRNFDINGVERNVSISISIDDEFHGSSTTVQYMADNYPAHALIDQPYGLFYLDSTKLNIEGVDPITSSSGTYHIVVTDFVGSDHDLSNLRLETEDVVTDWSDHSRIQFLDESASPYDWATWWGDAPTNELPPLLGMNRLDISMLAVPDYSTYINLDADPLLLHRVPSPVPVPAAAWLFGSGLIGFLSMVRRKKAMPFG